MFISFATIQRLSFLLLIVLTGNSISAQVHYEPSILVLTPGKVTVSEEVKKEYDTANNNNIVAMRDDNAEDYAQAPANIQLMHTNLITYTRQLNVSKMFSFQAAGYLFYRFFERFKNLLVLVKDTSAGPEITALQAIASQENMEYIINIPAVLFFMKDNIRYCKARFQLYEKSSNSLLINEEYTGNETNPGFEFGCQEGTLECTISNVLSPALTDIITQVAQHNPTLKREQELAGLRREALKNILSEKKYDSILIRQVIPDTDNKIHLQALYYCLNSPDNTQFVGFFLEEKKLGDLKSFSEKGEDENITIKTNKDIHDSTYLTSFPSNYGYIVKGVKYKSKWYYKKDKVTYFDAASPADGPLEYMQLLQRNDFFKENSADYDTAFWNGNLFKKIIDLSKSQVGAVGKEMQASKERENRKYIGLYEIVADELKKEKATEAKAFALHHGNTILEPFFKQLAANKSDHIEYDKIYGEFALIYPKDRHVILTPMKLISDKGKKTIHYYVSFPGNKQVYEWTYFPVTPVGDIVYEYVPDTIGSLTQWDFSYSSLDDDNFWEKYVLLKEGNGYKYLKQVNAN
ncbi:hypothetical protein ACE38W_14240 [Chitinophaga sp. Hz27]|uniref:hypothetical protein n=1 Tax=Chitinophaga sp. Hz27 TaxID=3347169 RepID=UPI0035D614EC